MLGFTADVSVENKPMHNPLKNMDLDAERRSEDGVYEMRMTFRDLEG
jgi:hypothetical protein